METALLVAVILLVVMLLISIAVLLVVLLRQQPAGNGSANLQVEIGKLTERTASLESTQERISQRLVEVADKLTESGTMTRSLATSTSEIHNKLGQAQESLAALHSHARARQDLEQRTMDSIRRLEVVIAGTQTRGAAGENIIDLVFSQLPAEWQVRNFMVGSKVVEFGLRLPNNLVVPIDSKWAAVGLLEEFLNTEEIETQQQVKKRIERAVMERVKEVCKYLDPNLTVSFGVATVPDSVYDLCGAVQVEALQMNVVLVSYSMFVPYLLWMYQTILRSSQSIDVQKLNAYLSSVQESLTAIQNDLESRFSRALTMLSNSRDEISAQVSKVNAGIAGLQVTSGAGNPDVDRNLPERN